MQKHRGRLQIPTQGNQVLLDPHGNYMPGIEPRGKRYRIPELLELLDRVLEQHPPHPERGDDLQLAWFLWNPEEQGLPGHFGAPFISRLDRRPVLTIHGEQPEWLEDGAFLRKHLRQFIWTRGPAEDGPRITIRQLEPQPAELASCHPDEVTPDALSRTLDRVWLDYMRVRPLVARGYIDNPHGNWLKGVMEEVHREELRLRDEALRGTLLPPGRSQAAVER